MTNREQKLLPSARQLTSVRRTSNLNSLTGLPERLDFLRQVQQLLTEKKLNGWCVLSIDIEHFKLFNNWYGQVQGDELLHTIGHQLAQLAKENDYIAGYFGGAADMIIMRFTDMVMSFPYILLVLVAASIFKPGLWSIILILGFVDWPGIARLVRGNVLSLRESNFIKSDLVAGMPLPYILFSEILPNTAAPILVYATSVLALSMLDEAALSFLGMGVQPPTASLGNMLNGAQSLTVLTKQPWLWIPSGLMIVVLVIAINFIGDALRDALDPNSGK